MDMCPFSSRQIYKAGLTVRISLINAEKMEQKRLGLWLLVVRLELLVAMKFQYESSSVKFH